MATAFNTNGKYDPDYSDFTTAATYAVPSLASHDNAAARIRSRLDNKQRSNSRAIQDQYAGRGIAYSGPQERAQRMNVENINQEYGNALGDFETEFMKAQQEGANILTNIGSARNAATTNSANASRGFLEALGNNAGIFGLIQNANPGEGAWSSFWNGIFGGQFNLPNSSDIIASVGGVQPGTGTTGTTTDTTGGGVVEGGVDTGTAGTTGGLGGPASVAPGPNPTTVTVGSPGYEAQVESFLKQHGGISRSMLDNIIAFYGGQPSWLLALKAKYNIPNKYWPG